MRSNRLVRSMLYIIRHGKTDWNIQHKLQGRTDIPLNDEGRKMAEKAALEYADIEFDVCYSSPLKRAFETAQIFLKDRNVPIITDDRLVEMGFGICEGMNGYTDTSCPVNVLFSNPEKYTTPVEGGESLSDLYRRTRDFLSTVVEPLLAQGKNVLIVGHGAMNSSIVCQVKGIPVDKFWSAGIENCKLMKLDEI